MRHEGDGTGPPARGVRLQWDALPARLRGAIEERLGSPVVEVRSQPGGFSPGLAARLRGADGRRLFVKAVGPVPNLDAADLHRREIAIASQLPAAAPTPPLLWSLDEGPGGWVVLAFEDVEGRQPRLPWRPDELARVLEAMQALAAALTPSPVAAESIATWFHGRGQGWCRLQSTPPAALDDWSRRHLAALAGLEARAPEAARGETLLHFDLRADNILLTADRVLFVDWPHARVGVAWVDLVCFAPSVAMQGGPAPQALLERSPVARRADPAALTAVVAAIAGFFTWGALQPPPPGIPTVRAFQAAQGGQARRWVAERTGWR